MRAPPARPCRPPSIPPQWRRSGSSYRLWSSSPRWARLTGCAIHSARGRVRGIHRYGGVNAIGGGLRVVLAADAGVAGHDKVDRDFTRGVSSLVGYRDEGAVVVVPDLRQVCRRKPAIGECHGGAVAAYCRVEADGGFGYLYRTLTLSQGKRELFVFHLDFALAPQPPGTAGSGGRPGYSTCASRAQSARQHGLGLLADGPGH